MHKLCVWIRKTPEDHPQHCFIRTNSRFMPALRSLSAQIGWYHSTSSRQSAA